MRYPWEGRTDIKSNRQEGRKDQKEDMIFAVVITIKARQNCKLTWNKFWNSTRAWAQIALKPEIFFRLINRLQYYYCLNWYYNWDNHIVISIWFQQFTPSSFHDERSLQQYYSNIIIIMTYQQYNHHLLEQHQQHSLNYCHCHHYQHIITITLIIICLITPTATKPITDTTTITINIPITTTIIAFTTTTSSSTTVNCLSQQPLLICDHLP